jgi:hypothetical protein
MAPDLQQRQPGSGLPEWDFSPYLATFHGAWSFLAWGARARSVRGNGWRNGNAPGQVMVGAAGCAGVARLRS